MVTGNATSATRRAAIVVGVGAESGLEAAVVRRFGREGFHVFVAGRTAEKIDKIAASVRRAGGSAEAIPTDTASEEEEVRNLFASAFARADGEAPSVVVFNAGNNARIPFRDITAEQFEDYWRVGCYGGFLGLLDIEANAET